MGIAADSSNERGNGSETFKVCEASPLRGFPDIAEALESVSEMFEGGGNSSQNISRTECIWYHS